jgi:hypothetical protein
MTQMKQTWIVARTVASAIALAVMGTLQPVAANDWAETTATCERLGRLITAKEIEKMIGKAPVEMSAAEPSRIDECKLDIKTPNAQTPRPNMAGITLSLRQHLSPQKAQANVQVSVAMSAGKGPPQAAAGKTGDTLVFLTYVFDYAMAAVGASEITVNVRDRAVQGPETAKALGQLLYQRAKESKEIAAHSASVNEVVGYSVIAPTQAMVQRCIKDDAPNRDAMQKVFDASLLKTVSPLPVDKMSDYAQRWIKTHQYPDKRKQQLKTIDEATGAALVQVCTKLAAELATLEQTIPEAMAHATRK